MLTPEIIESTIASEEYITLGKKTTACILTLTSGFEVVGTSACVKPEDYDIEKGKPFARRRALDKVWEVEGYFDQKVNSQKGGDLI